MGLISKFSILKWRKKNINLEKKNHYAILIIYFSLSSSVGLLDFLIWSRIKNIIPIIYFFLSTFSTHQTSRERKFNFFFYLLFIQIIYTFFLVQKIIYTFEWYSYRFSSPQVSDNMKRCTGLCCRLSGNKWATWKGHSFMSFLKRPNYIRAVGHGDLDSRFR